MRVKMLLIPPNQKPEAIRSCCRWPSACYPGSQNYEGRLNNLLPYLLVELLVYELLHLPKIQT